MKEESMKLMNFSTSMVFFSALLSIVVFSIVLGKNIGMNTFSKAENIQMSSRVGALKDLNGVEKIMPAATVFSLIEYHLRDIREITCYVCDPVNGEVRQITEDVCISNHLKGNVILLVTYNSNYGLFDIEIRPV